jgi:hypothetical protein
MLPGRLRVKLLRFRSLMWAVERSRRLDGVSARERRRPMSGMVHVGRHDKASNLMFSTLHITVRATENQAVGNEQTVELSLSRAGEQ